MGDREESVVWVESSDGAGGYWLKRYAPGSRRWRLAALTMLTRLLKLPALCPPPHPGGELSRMTEQARLQRLALAHVRVPQVRGGGPATLMLSDLGETLACRLARADPAGAMQLAQSAVDAIAAVHAKGEYLGQPLARNITVGEDGQIGFLDFEEDPGTVMSVDQAQCRDWLIFVSGSIRHLPIPSAELARILSRAWRVADPKVIDALQGAVNRLGFLPLVTAFLGRRARGLGQAVESLRQALQLLALRVRA